MTRRDPGMSPKAIRARVQLIAGERGLTKRQIAPVLKAASNLRSDKSTDAICNFAYAHGISFDWLLGGDLRGLRRMKELAPEAP